MCPQKLFHSLEGALKTLQAEVLGVTCRDATQVEPVDQPLLCFPGLGGWYSYRMSKAALNMATKNLSIELRRGKAKVVCVSLHPGTVDTDLSKPYHKNVPKGKLFSPEHSVNCLMHIIDKLDMGQTGKFFAWDGSELPW